MLDLENTLRTKLRASGALIIDDEGDEIFAGVNAADSKFFLDLEKAPVHGHATAEAAPYLCVETQAFRRAQRRPAWRLRTPHG
jgi:hypothetical protein